MCIYTVRWVQCLFHSMTHISKSSALHICCKPSSFLSKKSQKTVLLRRLNCTSNMNVRSLLHKALHLSGIDMSFLVWSNKDIVSVPVWVCSVKMKVFILSTPITLFGTVPLGQICGMALSVKAQYAALPRHTARHTR